MKKNNLFTRTNVNKRTTNYIGTVTVSPENMEKLHDFRQALKKIGKTVSLMGRNPNRKHLARVTGVDHEKLRQNVPQKWATSFDVYWRRP